MAEGFNINIPFRTVVPVLAGGTLVVIGGMNRDLTTIAVGGAVLGLPGLSSEPHTVIVKTNGDGHAKAK